MHIVAVNRFYWPEEPATAQLLTDWAEELVRLGHEVTVITSHSGDPALPPVETRHGVTIRRVSSTRWGGAGKIIDFATFQVAALLRLLRTAKPGDRVVALTDPPLLGIGAWLVARCRGACIYHWVQDIYPEIAEALSGHRWLRISRPLRNLAWRRADGCVTLGTDLVDTLTAEGVPAAQVTVVPNWAPAGLVEAAPTVTAARRLAWQLEGKFVVAYSGNLGRVHDLQPLLAVAEEVRAEPRILFALIGSGPQRALLEAEVVRRGLANVRFFPAQPRCDLAATLSAGDVHLVTLHAGCAGLVFPSKLYGIAAVGRPVIFIGPPGCELARLLTQHDFGHAFARNEIAPIAAAIRHLSTDATDRARLAAAAETYSRPHRGPAAAAATWQRLLSAGPKTRS